MNETGATLYSEIQQGDSGSAGCNSMMAAGMFKDWSNELRQIACRLLAGPPIQPRP